MVAFNAVKVVVVRDYEERMGNMFRLNSPNVGRYLERLIYENERQTWPSR